MISPRVGEQALWCGADDIDGTIVEEKIVHMAGAQTPVGLTVADLLRLIREAGRLPVQREFRLPGRPHLRGHVAVA